MLMVSRARLSVVVAHNEGSREMWTSWLEIELCLLSGRWIPGCPGISLKEAAVKLFILFIFKYNLKTLKNEWNINYYITGTSIILCHVDACPKYFNIIFYLATNFYLYNVQLCYSFFQLFFSLSWIGRLVLIYTLL